MSKKLYLWMKSACVRRSTIDHGGLSVDRDLDIGMVRRDRLERKLNPELN
jgi:hypothetical protein